MLVTQSCPTLCNLMDCSLLCASVHGILQARRLECVAIPFSRGSSWPSDWTWVFCIARRLFTVWATRVHNKYSLNASNYCFYIIFLKYYYCFTRQCVFYDQVLPKIASPAQCTWIWVNCGRWEDKGAWHAAVHGFVESGVTSQLNNNNKNCIKCKNHVLHSKLNGHN